MPAEHIWQAAKRTRGERNQERLFRRRQSFKPSPSPEFRVSRLEDFKEFRRVPRHRRARLFI